MDLYSYEKMCQDIASGGTHKVVNEDTKIIGEVQLCNHGFFNVNVGHGQEVWASDKCREVTPQEEWKFHKDHKA